MKLQQCMRYNNRVWHRLPSVALQFLSPSQPRQRRCFTSQGEFSTTPRQYRALETLDNADINHFRTTYFAPERPIILPRRSFCEFPAFERWFEPAPTDPNVCRLNTAYLGQHGAGAFVPLELTQSSSDDTGKTGADGLTFRQFHAPLSLFLDWIRTAETLETQSTRLYLAQCQLLDLPQVLRDDFPTPELVARAGKGDVYDTNVWIGYPPTYTPLHRDPNPNLFVQLAGQKVVRLLSPEDGQKIFGAVRRRLGRSGGREAAAIRGEEMMQGQERAPLEQAVWDDATAVPGLEGYEACLEAGDGMFIPRGWWHSIKGVGTGVTASVNWWFR
ncbi:putative JmjC domain protein [Aspergillus ibericus CBS 121593]|uniref:JmjC domain protein n=1 Tax=Aspergillus ibericus CBS 121593 TaxID=1448316 RepID=A0A395HE23_9EURO|nr:JmjC domain protein [Aspergillus ibericus CBS 121593]RAL05713.1 JmjC domain protein [Aspergillus ibericus CBS 121593]